MKNPGPLPALLPDILIVEPQFVLRRTIVAVAYDLGIARFHEATGSDSARLLLASRLFDGLVLDLCRAEPAVDLLRRLREGLFASAADIPVIAMTPATGDSEQDALLGSLGILSILRKPFKVAELLQKTQQMAQRAPSVGPGGALRCLDGAPLRGRG